MLGDGTPGGPTRKSWSAARRHDRAHPRRDPGHQVVARRPCARGSRPRSRAEHAHELVGDERAPPPGSGLPTAGAVDQAPSLRAPCRCAADASRRAHHRVVQPVHRRQPLPGHHEAERLRVARGQPPADASSMRARSASGEPRRQAGCRSDSSPTQRHERQRPRGAARPRGSSGSISATRRLDALVVAQPPAASGRASASRACRAGKPAPLAPPRWGPRPPPARPTAARASMSDAAALPPRRPC